MIEDKDIKVVPLRDTSFIMMQNSDIKIYANVATKCALEIATGFNEDGTKWATIYVCENAGEQGKGHMSEMFEWFARSFRERGFTTLGCTVALKPQIRHLCEKYNILEYR